MLDFFAISDLELSNKIETHAFAGRAGVDKSFSINPEMNISSNSLPENCFNLDFQKYHISVILEIFDFYPLANWSLFSHLSESKLNICTSVSGYILAATR